MVGGGASLQHASSPLGSVTPTGGSQQLQQFSSSPLPSTSTILQHNMATTILGTPPNPVPVAASSTPHPPSISSPSSSYLSDATPTNYSNGATPITDCSSKMVVPITAKTLLSSPLATGSKSILHHHTPIPQPNATSPLVKSSLPGGATQQLSSPRINFTNNPSTSAGQDSRSPVASGGAKFVTASKVSNEQFNSLLLQLQQNPNISRLLSAAVQSSTNGTS